MIKQIIKNIIYGNKSCSEKYVKYLRRKGANIGEGVCFFSPETANVDSVRCNWISIGKNTKITAGFTMLAHDYSSSVLIGKYHDILLPGGAETIIGSNCFVGVNVTILPGVTIGDNVIIGAGSVVTSNIPSNTVVGGDPAKIICSLDKYYEKRKENFLNDAIRNGNHFYDINGRYPFVNECGAFSVLFLERTEDNYSTYIKDYLAPGNDEAAIHKAFFETNPQFDSYEEYINFLTKEHQG